MSDAYARRQEPRLGCNCRACYYAREQHIEETLRNLYLEEAHSGIADTLHLPLVSQAVQQYLHGALGYDDMKTQLIKTLWTNVQERHKADVHHARLMPGLTILSPKEKKA